MKKVLLASTVLAMSATVAAAEVKISGDARMGVVNGFVHVAGARDKTSFSSRARVAFSMSGETDGGLAFGASLRADNAGGAAAGTAGSVFISGAFGKLTMGDVDGAAQSAVGHVDGVGYTGNGDKNEIAYLSAGGSGLSGIIPGAPAAVNGDPTALYEYSAGSLTVYASVTNPSFTFVSGADTFDGDAYALGAKYSMGDYTVSLGYEQLNIDRIVPAAPAQSVDVDHIVVGGDATFGQITVKARYGKADVEANGVKVAKYTQSALSATYAMDAISVTGFIANKSTKTPAGANIIKSSAYGIGASYSLGGGATLKGGISSEKITVGAAPSTKDTGFDLGVTFSF